MNKLTLLLLICIIPILSFSQLKRDSLMQAADDVFLQENYKKAHTMYAAIKSNYPKGSPEYNFVTDQLCSTYYYQKDDLRNQKKYEASNRFLKEFLKFIELEKAYIRPLWHAEQKSVLLMNIVMNHFSLNDYNGAKPYKAQLYKMWRSDAHPEEWKDHFFFDIFQYKDKNIYGYEYYQKLDDPENRAGFNKIVFTVYSTDENGNDKELLYELQVTKIYKRDENVKMKDYVLAQVFPKPKPGKIGGGMYEYTYDRIIDFSQLKKDILEVIDKS